MKKLVLTGVSALMLSATLFAGVTPSVSALETKSTSTIKVVNPISQISAVGQIEVSGSTILLKDASKSYILKGQITDLARLNGKTVRVSGTVETIGITAGRIINVTSFEDLSPVIQRVELYTGKVLINGAKKYLITSNKKFVLTGPAAEGLKNYNGATVRVTGQTVYNTLNFVVQRYEVVSHAPKILSLTGKVNFDGKSFFFTSDNKRFILKGNTVGLEKANGATIRAIGVVSGSTFIAERYEMISRPVVTRSMVGNFVVTNNIPYLYSVDGKKYTLKGNISGLIKLKKGYISVTGTDYLGIKIPESNIFEVRSYKVVQTPVAVREITTVGVVNYVSLEGGFYTIHAKEGKFALIGDKEQFKRLVNKPVRVSGLIKEDVATIGMTGTPLMVKSISEVKVDTLTITIRK